MPEKLLNLWLIDSRGKYKKAGQLLLRDEIVYFRYLPDYLNKSDSFPIDPVNLKLEEKIYSSRGLASPLLIFDDILPDTWGLAILSKKYKFDFFKDRKSALSHMDTSVVGGLVCLPEDKKPKPPRWIPFDYLETCFDEVQSFEIRKANFIFKYLGITGTSAGGARPKASFIDTKNSVWLVKFPSQNDPSPETVSEIEYAGLAFAEKMGIPVPERRLIKLLNGKALAIKRFDIIGNTPNQGRKILISLSTILGGMHMAEIGYEKIAATLRRYLSSPEKSVRQFFKMMLVNWCIVNTDDHLKNISLLWDGRTLNLSPAYDLVGNLWGMTSHTIPINGKNEGVKPEEIFIAGKKMKIKDALLEMQRAKDFMYDYLDRISKVKGSGQLVESVKGRLQELDSFLKT